MDSQTPNHVPTRSAPLPGWARPRSSDLTEADAAFYAGIALKALDDIVRTEPVWAGCWRARQALKCAGSAVRLQGRAEDEAALRDAVLLRAAGDDPGPAGSVVLAYQRLSTRRPAMSARHVAELAALFGLGAGDDLVAVADIAENALRSSRAVPFAVAELVTGVLAVRPDCEPLAWAMADMLIAARLKWDRPVPMMMAERFSPAFRTIGGRGRVSAGEAGFPRAVCLALAEGAAAAIRAAEAVARRADILVSVAPKVRTRGARPVIERLLSEDAMPASAPGSNLSRWAATRLFERLESLNAVSELSGRSSFRIYGL